MFKKLFSKLKEKKAITGTDVAAAVTVIVLTVGVVTAIYVNAINKSKDNIRYGNAVRIATNVIENIQKQPYEYLIGICKESGNTKTVKGGNGKAFETKIPNGYSLTVTLSNAETPDIARDVTVNVKYRASKTYKTITLTTVKEKEIIDMVNEPDFSLINGYKPNSTSSYYYPLKNTNTTSTKLTNPTWTVTTTDDVAWYDYSAGVYAVVGKTNNTMNVGATFPATSEIYVWIPRFAISGTNVQYLYKASNYLITLSTTDQKVMSYGLSLVDKNDVTKGFTKVTSGLTGFSENDGFSGLWYCNTNSANHTSPGTTITKTAKDALVAKVAATNLTFK